MILAMQKMITDLQNPIIKLEFKVYYRMPIMKKYNAISVYLI